MYRKRPLADCYNLFNFIHQHRILRSFYRSQNKDCMDDFLNVETGAVFKGYYERSLDTYVGIFCGKPHSNVWLAIGLAFSIFYRQANILKSEKFSDLCFRNQ